MGFLRVSLPLRICNGPVKPIWKLADYEAKIKNPSEALAVGDVILVRLKGKKRR